MRKRWVIGKSYGIAVNGSGHVFVTGTFYYTSDFDPGPGIVRFTSAESSYDIFVARYDAAGNYVYAKAMGGAGFDEGYSIAVDAADNAYVTGYLSGIVDFDPGPGIFNLTSAGVYDIFLVKIDAAGNLVFAKAMGSAGVDYGYGVAVDGLGNAYVTGSIGATTNFDPGGDSANSVIASLNGEEVFFAKFGPAIPLPAEVVDFTVNKIRGEKAVQVRWSIVSQVNNAYVEVQRSRNGSQFEAIGKRPGCNTCAGSQHYELLDIYPFAGKSYYRLKQVDLDGQITYGPIAAVEIAAGVSFQVHPTITENVYSVIIQNNPDTKQVLIQLLSASGALLNEHPELVQLGYNKFDYQLSSYAPGIYFIRVMNKNGGVISIARVIRK